MLVTMTAITRAIVTITIVDPKNIPATVADDKKICTNRNAAYETGTAPGRT